jgi:Caspase domain
MRRVTFNLVGRAPWALLLALVGLMFGGPAHAEKRVALVVGNSAYRNVTPLENPKNDAKLIADALRQSGFALVGGAA